MIRVSRARATENISLASSLVIDLAGSQNLNTALWYLFCIVELAVAHITKTQGGQLLSVVDHSTTAR